MVLSTKLSTCCFGPRAAPAARPARPLEHRLKQAPMAFCILTIALDTPLNSCFDYRWPCAPGAEPLAGQLALVSFGRREVVGLIVGVGHADRCPAPTSSRTRSPCAASSAPLSARLAGAGRLRRRLLPAPAGRGRAARPAEEPARADHRRARPRAQEAGQARRRAPTAPPVDTPPLNPAQQEAADAIGGAAGFTPILLYGVTGSGKTEVYLQACAQVLARDAQAQILILVPEINLTPQLEGNIRARFPGLMLATLHSSLSEGERMLHWLAAHEGQARIILGTRLSILASLPQLKLIVIDEEHDPSYKQQEGLRYSARDLAVWRARQLAIPIVLGSATPSLESWHHAGSGRYRKLELRERAVKDAVLPRVKLLDMEKDRPKDGLTSHLVAALKQRMERGEQSLLFLNRRGYAPVISLRRLRLDQRMHPLHLVHGAAQAGAPAALPPLQPRAAHSAQLPDLRQRRPAAARARHPARRGRPAAAVPRGAHPAHRRRLDPPQGQRAGGVRQRAPRRGRHPDRHPDGRQGPRLQEAHAGRHPQSRHRAVLAGLPRQRAAVRAADAGGRAAPGAPRAARAAASARCWCRPATPRIRCIRRWSATITTASPTACWTSAGTPRCRRTCTRPCCAPRRARSPIAIEFLEQARDCLAVDGVTINDPIPMTMTRVHNVDRAQLLVESSLAPGAAGLPQGVAGHAARDEEPGQMVAGSRSAGYLGGVAATGSVNRSRLQQAS